jgi:hypothetical protein
MDRLFNTGTICFDNLDKTKIDLETIIQSSQLEPCLTTKRKTHTYQYQYYYKHHSSYQRKCFHDLQKCMFRSYLKYMQSLSNLNKYYCVDNANTYILKVEDSLLLEPHPKSTTKVQIIACVSEPPCPYKVIVGENYCSTVFEKVGDYIILPHNIMFIIKIESTLMCQMDDHNKNVWRPCFHIVVNDCLSAVIDTKPRTQH